MSEIICGDCLGVMKLMPDGCVDSIVCDPPYGISFMGKKWDYDVPSVDIWQECLRVLKPGGHALVACGTRTQHRMAVNLEDAGFEIRDIIAWVYGSGFPKSLNIGKKIPEYEGWGTGLKPAMELFTLCRKPLSEKTIVANVLKHGTGGMNIDGCRVEHDEDCKMMKPSQANIDNPSEKHRQAGRRTAVLELKPSGRWPANVIHDGSDEVLAEFPITKSTGGQKNTSPSKVNTQVYGSGFPNLYTSGEHFNDSGSAARFFYCAKASKSERNKGLEGFEEKEAPASARSKSAEGRKNALGELRANHHPTIKPIALMRYLCRLITPPNGIVLDPFAGSGSTCCAAVLENFRYIGIELEQEYCEMSRARIKYWSKQNKELFEDLP